MGTPAEIQVQEWESAAGTFSLKRLTGKVYEVHRDACLIRATVTSGKVLRGQSSKEETDREAKGGFSRCKLIAGRA
ncbi:MAG: hypothetical protein ACPGLY_10005 [Rubripirellula sp.]